MKKQNLLQKLFTGFLILLVAVRVFLPNIIFAQEVTPTDTPTPTPIAVDQTTVNNTATTSNTTDSSANTGSNTVNPTPTPTSGQATVDPNITPTDTPTPTIDPNSTITPTPTIDPIVTIDPSATTSSTVTASNDATINNGIDTTSNTGSNSVTSNGGDTSNSLTPTPVPTSGPTPSQITVQTGDAISVVAGSNTINTTSINSNVTDQVINIYGDQTGDIDLSTLFQLVHNIVTADNNTSPVINVQITGVNNYAYLSNDAVSTANTGANTVNGDTNSNVVVNTGNAESVVSLINKVNLTVVNSSLHLVTINIFGHLTGNIILPNLAPHQSTTCSSCGVSFNTNNQAVVNNNITSGANTGTNNLTASGDATLTTGNALSETNTVNVVNQTILGMIFASLFINDFGNWNGSFLGWDSFGSQGSGDIALSSGIPAGGGTTPSGTINSTNINNTAYVNNNIYSFANTGGNNVNGGKVNVNTGTAYSAVSLINFINSNFMNSLGFFGFLNIFGNWNGNIGGADKFVTPTPTPEVVALADSVSHKENGGALSIENTNNVGAYVLPGDTVTFFEKIKDIGTGKVYGAKLNLYLIHNGKNVGGATFNLGEIKAGGGVKLSTGLVLSKDAEPGEYIAHAEVTGTTGDDNTPVSAAADSTFNIFGSTVVTNINEPQAPQVPVVHKAVLGTSTNHNSNTDQPLYYALLAVLLSYVAIRILRAKEQLVLLFTPGNNLKQRLNTLRLFLL